jgi:hypothetical protein
VLLIVGEGAEESVNSMNFIFPDFKGFKCHKGVTFTISGTGVTKIHPEEQGTLFNLVNRA